ncbi:MAG: protein translocase subunit SecF [Dehalococcoidia bacterium]|nr:protein translocase subunit SecF [Dehalococcoidia bacterium]
MLNIVGKRYWYFLFSLLIIVPGVISLLIPPALRPGIEFTSGSMMTLKFERAISQEELRDALKSLGHGDAVIQHSGENTYLVRTRMLGEETKNADGTVNQPAEKTQMISRLSSNQGPVQVLSFDTVSPIIASEIVRNASIAVALASLGILFYISWAFRKVPNPFRYGLCAIVALLHDALVVLGVFSILGKLFNIEIDSMFITALLTVIGFSVHDTIVVFDRIRENLRRGVSASFEEVVNHSLLQTIGRSLNTSLTVVFTLLALYLFGGVTIRSFVLALLVGIISGTYSSIFNASMLLVIWENGELGRLFRRTNSRQALVRGR